MVCSSLYAPTHIRSVTSALTFCTFADSLTVGIFVLPSGRLGDIYGHRRLLLIGYIWFSLSSLLAGLTVFAKSPIFFCVCRAFQGIGPAVMLPNSVAILGRSASPLHQRFDSC